ncbi:hypothetical protein DYB31_004024 [Aphanomyces astaci]|uniref:Uncharacterized protein n=1 Tax=Aphanomyces astaci TaxID=112090 RepID=A0A397ET43_APHAT|nr:hypothetical protein DYB31_004024 [Aphanomyces astaci]
MTRSLEMSFRTITGDEGGGTASLSTTEPKVWPKRTFETRSDDVFLREDETAGIQRAWSAITSSMTYKLQQGQLNADLQEKEAKALLCPPRQVKRTFFAIGARKLPKPSPPPPVEGAPVQAVVDVPDPVVDSLESLVHVYATNSTATSLRYTFSTMDRVVGLTLADDVLFLAVHFESGAVDVYRTPNLASDLASESVAALDASSLVLHVDPSSYRIQAPNKGVASDAAATAAAVTATPAATKGDKHKDKGKGNKDLVVEDVALAVAPPDTILGQADGTVTVLDARNGDILGSLSLDGRLPIVDAPMSALSFVVGDAVYVPTSATEGNQSLRSIHLNMYSLNLPMPPATKGLHAIYMRMLQKHEAVAIERDARMAKRRADVLKSLNSIW